MKNFLIVSLIIVAALSSCKKDDKSVFDKSPDERLKEKLDAYQVQLSGAQDGWKGLLVTDSGRGSTYSFYFKFNNENRVVMLSDFDSLSAVTLKESSYRLKALQQPSLLFDTYSYLHVLADPDGSVNGGPVGAGLLSDFEFYFDAATSDTIKLVGRFNASKMTLVRATKAEADAYNNGQFAAARQNLNKILTYFKRLTIGSQLYDVKIDPVNRQLVFSWLDASGNLRTFTTGYYFSGGSVVFTDPLVNGPQIISGLDNITWNQATETIHLTVNGAAATLRGIVVPLKVDLGAPQRFKQYAIDQGSYWISINGWHIDGVDDALNFRSLIRNYNFILYTPKESGLFGWTSGDLGVVIYDNGNSALGSSYTSTINNGIIKFVIEGSNGSIGFGTALPAAQAALVVGATNSFRSYMTDPGGYYLVQTTATTYDMVSAANGKAWITWEF